MIHTPPLFIVSRPTVNQMHGNQKTAGSVPGGFDVDDSVKLLMVRRS